MDKNDKRQVWLINIYLINFWCIFKFSSIPTLSVHSYINFFMKKAIGNRRCNTLAWGGGVGGNSVAITVARIRAGWSGIQIPEVTKVFFFSKPNQL